MIWTDKGLKEEVEKLNKIIIDLRKDHEEKVIQLNGDITRIGNECSDLREANIKVKNELKLKEDILGRLKEVFKAIIN